CCDKAHIKASGDWRSLNRADACVMLSLTHTTGDCHASDSHLFISTAQIHSKTCTRAHTHTHTHTHTHAHTHSHSLSVTYKKNTTPSPHVPVHEEKTPNKHTPELESHRNPVSRLLL